MLREAIPHGMRPWSTSQRWPVRLQPNAQQFVNNVHMFEFAKSSKALDVADRINEKAFEKDRDPLRKALTKDNKALKQALS